MHSFESDNDWLTTNSYTISCVGCVTPTLYPTTTLTPTAAWQFVNNTDGGEYSQYSVVSGNTYEWSLCSADGGSASYDTELTLTTSGNILIDFNDDFCGTRSRLTWVATFTGIVRVHLTEYHCLSNSISTTLAYKAQVQAPTQYTISASASPSNGGAVSGGGTYTSGQQITLTAAPNSGWVFNGWSENGSIVWTGNNYTFNVTGNRTLVAQFSQQQFSIALNINNSQGGIVSGGGFYTSGQQVTVTATPNPGWRFNGWSESGILVSNSPIYSFTALNNRSLLASFEIDVSTEGIIEATHFKSYPNPTSDYVTVEVQHQTLSFNRVLMYNVLGQVVQTVELNGSDRTILDMTHLPQGIYLLKVFTVDNDLSVQTTVVKN
jgi:hypothetical protein